MTVLHTRPLRFSNTHGDPIHWIPLWHEAMKVKRVIAHVFDRSIELGKAPQRIDSIGIFFADLSL